MNTNSALLRTSSVFWSKLGFCYDPPRMGKDGKPIVFFDNFDQVKKYHADFYEAGIKLHTSILFTGWVGVEKYDYELTDRVLEAIFSCGGKDLMYIPRIKLNVPIDWSYANPEELCVYADGPRDAESIRALVGTPKHDYLGYPSPRGYYTAGGWQDDRPNVGGVISNQSFSSQKWLRDAGEALKRLLDHLENGPYAEQIAAYHIAYGASGESCLWGRCNVHNDADFGIANRRSFFDWGMRRCGTLEALRLRWRQPGLTRENIEIPVQNLKEGPADSISGFLRTTREYQMAVDYDQFINDVNVDALEHFGKIVKKRTAKPVGAFYGYIMSVARANYTGYSALQRVIDSPYIDFLAAPKSEPAGEAAPVQSINRKKLWMDELDNRTFLARGTGFEYKSSGLDETRNLMWREFAKNLAHQSSFWWMDLGGGWYDHPDLLSEIGRIERTALQLRAQPGHSTAQVCVVVDDTAIRHYKTQYYLHHCLFHQLTDAMNRSGVPVDIYLLNDLHEMPLDQYRCFVFVNTFYTESAQWLDLCEKMRPDATVIRLYHMQCSAESAISLREHDPCYEGVFPCSGLLQDCESLRWTGREAGDVCPVIEQLPAWSIRGGDVLARYPDGAPAAATWMEKGRRHVFSAVPLFRAEHYRRLFAAAQVTLTAPENVLVYADSRFTGFFAWVPCRFTPALAPGRYFEAVSETFCELPSNLELDTNQTKIFIGK